MQQVGGSLGVAFLNTIATSATSSYAASHAGFSKAAEVHGFTHAFGYGVGILVIAFISVMALIRLPKSGGEDADGDAVTTTPELVPVG